MIHFKIELKDEALKLIKTDDYLDLYNDLIKIVNVKNNISNCVTSENLFIAQNLNEQIRTKYPIIDELLEVGNYLLGGNMNNEQNRYSIASCLCEYLNQDIFGILCHVLIKEKVIKTIDQFIDHVD